MQAEDSLNFRERTSWSTCCTQKGHDWSKSQAGCIVGTGGETEQAVGRLVGSLCAITARDEDAESAMLASWISQVLLQIPLAGLQHKVPDELTSRATLQ